MITILTTDIFDNWMNKLKDPIAKAKIQARIARIRQGNFGDISPIGEGFSELRIYQRKGYRVYLKQLDENLVLLLGAGDKSTQQRDIINVKLVFKTIEEIL